MEYQEYQVHIIHQVSRYHPELQGIWVDDAGAGGVSFRCSNGYDLDAGADIHYTSVATPSHKVFLQFCPQEWFCVGSFCQVPSGDGDVRVPDEGLHSLP